MKFYSNTLTEADFYSALTRTPDPVYMESFEPLNRPQIRTRGWNVLIGRDGSHRPFATGTRGAGDRGAATWDDWGRYLAVLFDMDPDLQVPSAKYAGRASFHARTQGAYGVAVVVRRDGELRERFATGDLGADSNAAFVYILKHQPQSVSWACRYERWAIVTVTPDGTETVQEVR
jgi:hypothetical protein